MGFNGSSAGLGSWRKTHPLGDTTWAPPFYGKHLIHQAGLIFFNSSVYLAHEIDSPIFDALSVK
jgi:hypothetical protein